MPHIPSSLFFHWLQASALCQGQHHAQAGSISLGQHRGCPKGRPTSRRAADRAEHEAATASSRSCRYLSAQKVLMELPRRALELWQRTGGSLARWLPTERMLTMRRPCLARENTSPTNHSRPLCLCETHASFAVEFLALSS